MSARNVLDQDGLVAADLAYIEETSRGATKAHAVKRSIRAYLDATAPASATQTMIQFVTTLPDNHLEMPRGQILHRSFDSGATWETCTRPDGYSTWSRGIGSVPA